MLSSLKSHLTSVPWDAIFWCLLGKADPTLLKRGLEVQVEHKTLTLKGSISFSSRTASIVLGKTPIRVDARIITFPSIFRRCWKVARQVGIPSYVTRSASGKSTENCLGPPTQKLQLRGPTNDMKGHQPWESLVRTLFGCTRQPGRSPPAWTQLSLPTHHCSAQHWRKMPQPKRNWEQRHLVHLNPAWASVRHLSLV